MGLEKAKYEIKKKKLTKDTTIFEKYAVCILCKLKTMVRDATIHLSLISST